MDKNIINVKHLSQNLTYVFFGYSSSIKYKLGYLIATIQKPFSLFIHGSIKNHFPFAGKYKIKNFYGTFEIIEPSDMHGILSPYSEKELTSEFLEINSGIFLDIGTNIGKYSILMAKKGMEVYSFEPNQIIYDYLINNIALNGLEKNIQALNIGVGEEVGNFELHIPKGNNYGSGTFLKNTLGEIEIQASIKCKIDNIENIIKEKNIDTTKIRLIKIDTEGYELHIIKSIIPLLKRIENCKIIIEIDSEENFKEIFTILESNGFGLKKNYIKNYIFLKQK